MQLLGRDTVTGKAAAQGGIYAAPHVFDGTHPNMTPEMWKQIPAAMADPIAVFDSDSPAGRARGDLVFMLELTDANGATVVVPVALDTSSVTPKRARANIVKSAYAKENDGIPSNRWFERQLKKNARYVNGQKIKRWQHVAGVYFPIEAISNAFKNMIYSKADLVNLRQGDATLYQTAYHGTPHRFDDFSVYQEQADGGQPTVTVRGDELGVPEGAEIKAYRKAAREVYRELQKTPAYREDLGDILFTKAGWGEFSHTGADVRKWKLIPQLKKLIEKAEYIERHELYKQRHDNIVAFHWLETDVLLDNERLRVGLQIAEDADGNKFYNLNQDLEGWQRKYNPLGADPATSNAGPQGDSEVLGSSQKNKPGSQEFPQGATAPVEPRIPVSDNGVNLYILSEPATREGAPRARVTFDAAEGGRAVIEFFSAADASSAPHELYHIFRREMAESAARPDAPQRVREDWARIEEFVGAEPGQAWTREMEETFARAGERFLLEGKAPTPALQGVFERLRQWFLELYANADAAGLHISPAMREVFGNMLSVPAGEGDMAFRRALGRLLSRPVGPEGTAATPPQADMPPLEEMRAMMAAAEQELDRALTELGARQTVSCDVRAGEGEFAGLAFICKKLFYECLIYKS